MSASEVPKKSDAELLQILWRRQLEALVAKLEGGESVTAAELNVVRAFLSDNGVNNATLNSSTQARSALEGLADRIPAFHD